MLPRPAEVAQPDPLKGGGEGEHPAEDGNIRYRADGPLTETGPVAGSNPALGTNLDIVYPKHFSARFKKWMTTSHWYPNEVTPNT